MSTFDSQLHFGKIGEGAIAHWLREKKGFHVLPIYEKEISEGKGPVLFSLEGELIAPDLFCFRKTTEVGTDTLWIEAKTKSAFTWHRISQQWLTGIDMRHYEDYLKVAHLSPFPVWLLFLHLAGTAKDTPQGKVSPTGLFGRELLYLAKHEDHRHENWGRTGMVYWAHKTLLRLAALDEVSRFARLNVIPAESL